MNEHRQRDLEAGLALFELAPRLTRFENAVLNRVSPPLTFRQYRILQRVTQGHTTVSALGRLATITLPAVSESVELLVRKQLLLRKASDEDRRSMHLELTPSGSRALERADELLEEAAEQILEGIPTDRRQQLAKDARQVTGRVSEALLEKRDVEESATST